MALMTLVACTFLYMADFGWVGFSAWCIWTGTVRFTAKQNHKAICMCRKAHLQTVYTHRGG